MSVAKLTPLQSKIVKAYLAHRTTLEAALAVGITVESLRTQIKLPKVREAIRVALADAVDDAMQTLAKAATEAANCLVEAIYNGDMLHPQRLKMLEFVLERAVDFSKLRFMETEIETMRHEIEAAKNQQRANQAPARVIEATG